LERYEPDATQHGHDPQEALKDLIELAEQLGEVRNRSGMAAPTVIT
jgi:phosphoglucomutase